MENTYFIWVRHRREDEYALLTTNATYETMRAVIEANRKLGWAKYATLRNPNKGEES